jgi:acetyltransferase
MEIEIRRITPGDAERLSEFYAALSRESLHARFLGTARGISGTAARTFCTPDHMHDEGFVAIAHEEIGEPFVGHVCVSPIDATAIEIGICVADEWQGRGIGRRLFETAISWARDHGYETIVASCFADNWRVLALLSSAPHPARISPASGGVVDVTIPLRGPIPTTKSSPPYSDGSGRTRRGRPLRPLRVSWRRTPRPERVSGD